MATVNVSNVIIRKNDQFDVLCLTNGGKTIAAMNISVDEDDMVIITYARGNKCVVLVKEVDDAD